MTRNGFSLMAESIRKTGDERTAELYDFLANCSDQDICKLFDSTIFNEIAKGYMRETVRRLIDNGIIDAEQGRFIRNQYSALFEDKCAQELLNL